jgi:hypothetical protein
MSSVPLFFACGAVGFSLAADMVILGGEGHAEFWWSHIYGFFSLFGLVGCLATIIIAKILGERWLERKESYYDINE